MQQLNELMGDRLNSQSGGIWDGLPYLTLKWHETKAIKINHYNMVITSRNNYECKFQEIQTGCGEIGVSRSKEKIK